MKRPSFQFYPADWRKDAALQSCSMAAQGLWINMLCVAHECEPYGHLVVNGKPMQAAQIARLVGLSAKECDRLLAELIDAGVASVGEEGAFYSRRMVRDEEVRSRRAEGGKAGSEFGHLGAEHGAKGGRPRKGTGDKKPPSNPPPSSSSSSSSSTSPPTVGDDGRASAASSGYAFEGRVIRLNQRDFDRWKATYSAIPDLRAELSSLDDWLSGQPEDKRKRWFHVVSGSLSRKHQEWLDKRQGPALDLLSAADEDPEATLWRTRLKGWRERRFWSLTWGGPPGDPDCYVPKRFLEEIRETAQ